MCKPLHASRLRCTVVRPRRAVLSVSTDGVGGTVSHMDDRAFLQSHHSLGLAILVPVVGYDVLFVVLEVAHIRTAVDPPEERSVHFQHFQDGVFAVVALFWEVGTNFVLVVELHQYLQLTVAVHVGTAGVIGH